MENLTIIIPCFNEEKSIKVTIENLLKDITQNNLEWTIIIINDGSTDTTLEEIQKIRNDKVKILQHPYNKGYGASLKSGIRNAKTDLVAFYDADGQHQFTDLYRMYENVQNLDMLIGERGKDSHNDWVRKPGKWVLSKVANYLTGRKIPDLNSGLRIIKRNIIYKLLHLFPDGFSFSTTSTIAFMNMGYNTGYYPIRVKKRIGKSTVKQLKHGSSTIMLILRLIVLFNPLKVFLPISGILFLGGIIYEVVWGIILISGLKVIAGALLLILSGILVFFFGLMTDQISSTRKYLTLRSED